jgi:hypothetical protein
MANNYDIKELAAQCLKESLDPDGFQNFQYYGELDLGNTWGFSFSKHRDSDLINISNFDCIVEDLNENFDAKDWEIVQCSHWAVGHIEHIAIRVLDKHGEPTKIFEHMLEFKRALEDYPLLDDEDFSRREYEIQIEAIQEYIPSELRDEENVEQKVFGWLWDNKPSSLDLENNSCWNLKSEDVLEALTDLGLWEEEIIDD